MSSLVDQVTELSVFVEDFLIDSSGGSAGAAPPPGDTPAFSDAAVLTRALWPGCLGGASLKQTDGLVAHH